MIVKRKKEKTEPATADANTLPQGTYVPKLLCSHPERIEII